MTNSDILFVDIAMKNERCVDIKEAWERIRAEIFESTNSSPNSESAPCKLHQSGKVCYSVLWQHFGGKCGESPCTLSRNKNAVKNRKERTINVSSNSFL